MNLVKIKENPFVLRVCIEMYRCNVQGSEREQFKKNIPSFYCTFAAVQLVTTCENLDFQDQAMF